MPNDKKSKNNTAAYSLLSKKSILRRFTVQATKNCDMLVLSIKDILQMKLEFPSAFREIFMNSKLRLESELLYKFEVIMHAE